MLHQVSLVLLYDISDCLFVCMSYQMGIRRYLFWSDWYRPAVIMRGFTDGSNAIPLVNTTLGWPYGLALDYT